MGEMVSLIADAAAKNPSLPGFMAILAVAHLEAGYEEAARELVDEGAAESFTLPGDGGWFETRDGQPTRGS